MSPNVATNAFSIESTVDLTVGNVLALAKGLLTEESDENVEYDRAIAELTCEILGVSTDHKDAMLLAIRHDAGIRFFEWLEEDGSQEFFAIGEDPVEKVAQVLFETVYGNDMNMTEPNDRHHFRRLARAAIRVVRDMDHEDIAAPPKVAEYVPNLRGVTSAETCQLNGWKVGTLLRSVALKPQATIKLTRINDGAVFAQRLDYDGTRYTFTQFGNESRWELNFVDWEVVDDDDAPVGENP